MPIANKYSMDELMEAARYYTRTTGRRITFEYSLVKGVNDKKEHAQELISRVKGMNCHINLIPVNPIKERDFEQSTQNNVAAFKHIGETTYSGNCAPGDGKRYPGSLRTVKKEL